MKIDIVPRPQKLEINLENKNILKFNLSPISIFQSKINFPEDSDSHWFWWFPVGICRYKRVVNHMTCYNFKCFHWQKIYLKKNPLQDLLSSLNAVISTNESTQIITGDVIYNLAYTCKFQLKEPPLISNLSVEAWYFLRDKTLEIKGFSCAKSENFQKPYFFWVAKNELKYWIHIDCATTYVFLIRLFVFKL